MIDIDVHKDWGSFTLDVKLHHESGILGLLGDDLCAIGIRRHAFCGGDGENARPIVVTEEIEQPFEWIVKFRYAHQEGGTPDIWWRFAKPDRPAVLPDCLTVDGQAILLLYR